MGENVEAVRQLRRLLRQSRQEVMVPWNSSGVKDLDSGCILKVERTESAGRWDLEDERQKKLNNDSKVFSQSNGRKELLF